MIRIGTQLSGLELALCSQIQRADANAAQAELRQELDSSLTDICDEIRNEVGQAAFQERVRVLTSALAQVDSATSVTAQAQLAIDLIRTQANKIRAALSTACQANIEQALREIDRLATDEFQGRALLDGSCDFGVSGQNRSQVREVSVDRISGPTRISAAKPATLIHRGRNGQLTSDADFTLSGPFGDTIISLEQNQTFAEAAAQINASTALTGVQCFVNGDQLSLVSIFAGAEAAISVDVHFGQFVVASCTGEQVARGADTQFAARPSIVGHVLKPASSADANVTAEINGQIFTGQRIVVSESAAQFALEFVIGFAGELDPITLSDTSVWKFQLSTASDDVTTLALPNLTTQALGGASGQLTQLRSSGNPTAALDSHALRIVDEALAQLDREEQRLEAFADDTIASSAALLAGLKASLEETYEEPLTTAPPQSLQTLPIQRQLSTNILNSLTTLGQQSTSVLRFLQIVDDE